MDQYELIRRRFFIDGQSRRAIARELGHSRKTIDKALACSSPPGYVMARRRARPAVAAIEDVARSILAADASAPPKQRHTASRIYQRLRDEHGYLGSEVTIRRYVRELRQGQAARDVPLVLSFEPGEEGQVDWGEALIIENGQEERIYLFEMRLAYSKASFVHPYRQMTMEAFLDGHVRAFEYFGGVPRRVAYDNLKTAVVKINGRERRLTESFKQLRSHYLFESRFCNIASGNEKGDVENLVKRSKSQYLTPVPEVRGLGQLAGLLFDGCQKDLERMDRGQSRCRRELLQEERGRMLPLPAEPFAACRQKPAYASKQALVRFEDNDYSIPSELAHRACTVRAFVDELAICCNGREVARHARCYGSGEYILEPGHFLGELERKPGALDNALAFKSLLKDEDLQLLRRELRYRHGEAGDKQFIAILQLLKQYPLEAFSEALSRCIRLRLFALEAVRQELTNRPVLQPPCVLDLAGREQLKLETSGRRDLGAYSQLLGAKPGLTEEVG